MALRWFSNVVGTEGSPILFCSASTYEKWRGNEALKGKRSDYDRVVLDEGFDDPVDVVKFGRNRIGLVDTDGGGPYDIGVGEREVVIAGYDGDFDDASKRSMADAIARGELDEFHAADIELGEGGLVIADSACASLALDTTDADAARAFAEARFFAPLPAGRYAVHEGDARDAENREVRWCRLLPAGARKRARRPKVGDDPVESIMGRISFADPKSEARALEAAVELIDLGKPELALEVAGRASEERRALASCVRVRALAALQSKDAAPEATALARQWLTPATSATSFNQVLPREHVLRALDAALASANDAKLATLRAEVAAAPEPDVFVPDQGDFF